MLSRIGFRKISERGQGFMELAISMVFLLVLLSAMVDLGWAFYTMISLRDAAQEAAVYGIMCPVNSTNAFNETGIRDRLRASADSPIDIADIPDDDIEVCVIDPDNPTDSCASTPLTAPQLGFGIRVEATIQHTIRVPFLGAVIGRNSYPLSVDVTDIIMRDEYDASCDN